MIKMTHSKLALVDNETFINETLPTQTFPPYCHGCDMRLTMGLAPSVSGYKHSVETYPDIERRLGSYLRSFRRSLAPLHANF